MIGVLSVIAGYVSYDAASSLRREGWVCFTRLAAGSWLPKTRKQVTKIWERLYLGSLKDAEQLARSNPQRITTVVSLCREQAIHRAPKITYIHIPIPASPPILTQKFKDIFFSRPICS